MNTVRSDLHRLALRTLPWFLMGAMSICLAQETNQPVPKAPADGERAREAELEIPLPIQSPRALPPGTLEPLTAKQKAVLAFHNVFYPRAVANRLIWATVSHVSDSPEEWSDGGEGFAKRFGFRMGSLATRQAIQLAGDIALGTEPRYDICECTGFVRRTSHAWRRVVTARKDNGEETIGVARIAASLGTPWVTHNWLPDRYNTTGDKLTAGVTTLAVRGLTNMIREFWPEVSRKTHLPARFRKPRD